MVPSSEAGLTLVEVMVALAIIAVMSSVAVLAVGGMGRGATTEAEARRLAARLRLAADETMVTSRGLALQWDRRGYGFVSWDAASRGWKPSEVGALGERHDLPSGMTLEGAVRDGPAPIAVDGVGPPLALELRGRTNAWRVAFDGLNVAATPAAGS